MINIITLRNIAKMEYIKNTENYNKKHRDIFDRIKNKEGELKEAPFSKNKKIQEELTALYDMLNEYQVLEIIDTSNQAAEILINPKYASLLSKNSKKLENDNLGKTELLKTIQETDLFANMWIDLYSISSENVVSDLNHFAVAFDLVLDLIASRNCSNLDSLIRFNDEFTKIDSSLAEEIYKKVQTLGKDKTMTLLDDFTSEESLFSTLPMGYKANRFEELINTEVNDSFGFFENSNFIDDVKMFDLPDNIIRFAKIKTLNKKQEK